MTDSVGAAATDTSFDALYEREVASLVALGLSLTGSREAARDVAQEALLRAFRDWSRVQQLDRPGAWVRRVAINLATDAHRRIQREQRAVARLAAEPVPSVFGEPAIDQFWTIVRDLPDRQRAAVALRYVDDFSVEQIAEVLQISVGAVTKSLFVARAALASGYTRTVSLSVLSTGAGVWSIASWNDDVEAPTQAAIVHDGETGILSRPGFDGFAFRADEFGFGERPDN